MTPAAVHTVRVGLRNQRDLSSSLCYVFIAPQRKFSAGAHATATGTGRRPGAGGDLDTTRTKYLHSKMTHRVTVKTLKHDIVHLDLPHDCTVDECKEHLRSHRPDWRGGQLRLMSNGKQLTEGTLAAAGVFEYVEAAEDRFIVALFTATKPATRAAVAPPTLPAMAPSRKRSGGNESFLVACVQRLRDTNVSAEAKGRRQWASARPTQPEPPEPAEWLIAAPTPSEAAEAAAQAAEAAREAATHAAALEVVQAAEALAQLMAMGFGEAESARALRAERGRCLRRRSRRTPSPVSALPLHLRCTSAAPPLHLRCPPLHLRCTSAPLLPPSAPLLPPLHLRRPPLHQHGTPHGSVAAAVDSLTGGTPAATAAPPPSAAVAGLRGLGREVRAMRGGTHGGREA